MNSTSDAIRNGEKPWAWAAIAAILFAAAAIVAWHAWHEWSRPEVLLVAEPERVDLGVLEPQATYSVTFLLNNAGTAALEILSLESSCSCTASSLDKDRLLPGETAALKAALSTGSQQGEIRSRLGVVFRAPGASAVHRKSLDLAGSVAIASAHARP